MSGSKLVSQESNVVVEVVNEDVRITTVEEEITIVNSSAGPQGVRGSLVLSGSGNPSSVIGLIGDQYINTTTGYLFGPKSASGWGAGSPIAPPNSMGQLHNQTSPSATWNILHTLNFIPNIIIVDTSGNVVEPEIQYLSANQIQAIFSQPMAGKAYVS